MRNTLAKGPQNSIREWAKVIRGDAPAYSEFQQKLVAIADAMESGTPNREIMQLIRLIPPRVQNAVIPMAALAYLASNRNAYMKVTMSKKLQARIARVSKVLARLVTANAKIGYKVTVDGVNGPEEREGEISVPTSGTYRDFFEAMVSAITAKEGEFDIDDLDSNPTPLRIYLEAQKPARHEATGLFYDWIENNYQWYRPQDIEALSANTHGFAGTPWTWDYYADASALLNDYGHVFIDDDDMYDGEDEAGRPIPKSDEDQADVIWHTLENGNDILDARENELVSGDYLIIRWS